MTPRFLDVTTNNDNIIAIMAMIIIMMNSIHIHCFFILKTGFRWHFQVYIMITISKIQL